MFYRVSSNYAVCGVETNRDDIVVMACPMLRMFVGQPFINLERWATRQHFVIQAIVNDLEDYDALFQQDSSGAGDTSGQRSEGHNHPI